MRPVLAPPKLATVLTSTAASRLFDVRDGDVRVVPHPVVNRLPGATKARPPAPYLRTGTSAARLERKAKMETAKIQAEVNACVCEGGGWVLSAYQGSGAPNFTVCDDCGNPLGRPSP